jgi:hypothetical protein
MHYLRTPLSSKAHRTVTVVGGEGTLHMPGSNHRSRDDLRLPNKCDSSGFVRAAAAILLGCDSKLLTEDIGHVALTGKSTSKRDVGQRYPGLS